ncbi:TIGR04104 family putative zinc finger protein [Planococcus wigleyi]|uniref:Cxxc_20_cxxc protein n=1 Tax=Planococcus wigleyi TaxID=2762216 RepID=A0ABR8WGM5_9BACL|nr:TIGR04104 family putative zinc finger protein [Planococcus wigleyi]MBD8015846.1 hypothetical protein [Planococcus wigleyi]
MPVCERCGTQWTWKQSIMASWKIHGPMHCPNCKGSQYATPRSRQRMTLINWMILLPLPFAVILDFPLVYTVGMMIGLLAIGLSLIPKFLQLTSEQKALW